MEARFMNGPPGTVDNETLRVWPVYWSAIWVGALAALAVALITGLAGVALGTHVLSPGEHLVSWRKVHFGGITWTICSAFFSFVIGGWVAAKVAGHPRSESAMLHGAITWLVVLPFLVTLAFLGAGEHFGAWYTGLAGSPNWIASRQVLPDGVDAFAVARNSALATLTALILGLLGSVIGGWMASGEPMTFFHYRTRSQVSSNGRPVTSGMKNTAPSA